jgi:iron complex outermembrane recepter protein
MINHRKVEVGASSLSISFYGLTPMAAALMVAMPVQAQVLEEVTVTATRRAQTTQEIPYNISALTGADLKNSGVTGSADILQQIPGVFVGDVGGRSGINPNMSIRGISANNPNDNNIIPNLTEAPVGTYIGDVPLFTVMKLTDLDRVEILRGPQGTLYGSGSVGGAIRFIFNKPDPEAFEGSIAASISNTRGSGDLNYSTDLVLNMPLGESSALRVVAGWEEMGGYIDMPNLWGLDSQNAPVPAGDFVASGALQAPVRKDANSSDTVYIRGSLLWDISETVSAQLSVYHQEDTFEGDSFRHITNLEDSSGPRNISLYERMSAYEYETNMLSLEVSADLGFATLTSSTSWTDSEAHNEVPATELYQFLDQELGAYFGFPRISAYSDVFDDDEVFVQEFRLVSQNDSDLSWILGAFYKSQGRDGGFLDRMPGFNDWLIAAGFADFTPFDPGYTDVPAEFLRKVDYEDIAVFGELTYQLTDAWQVTGGLRFFKQDFEQDVRIRFPYCSFFCAGDEEDLLGTTLADSQADFDDLIFKINTSYNMTDSHMAYFTFSQGFRHGGANALPLTGPFAVNSSLIPYGADELDNWEVGLKGYLGNRRYAYTVSYFMSYWDNVQLDAFLGLLLMPGVLNGESARSQGLEVDFEAGITERLVARIAYSYTDAQLEDSVDLGGLPVFKGDPLPGVSDHSLSIIADYTLPLRGGSELTFHMDASYRSDFSTAFNPLQPSYAELDGFELVNVSTVWSSGPLSVAAFVNNLTDEEGVTAVSTQRNDAYPQGSFAFVKRPRTYGLSVSYEF